MNKGIIYIARCRVNGKVYIGQTIRSLEACRTDHLTKKNCRIFYRALHKHGSESFEWEILHTAPAECLNTLERIEILRHNSVVPNGYNLSFRR